MAQGGGKSRIIIWSIVGVLVVVAVILLATRPKTQSGPKVDVASFTETMNKSLDKLTGRMDRAGLTAEERVPIEAEMQKVRGLIDQMAATEDQNALRKMADDAHAASVAARKAFNALKGEEGDGE
jgi:hypothetical protein